MAAGGWALLSGAGTAVKASSTLNGSTKEFGPRRMFDGSADSCWNSDQGHPQWFEVDFKRPVALARLELTFQGGFVGGDATVAVQGPESAAGEWTPVGRFYPADSNDPQGFDVAGLVGLDAALVGEDHAVPCTRVRVEFASSSDMFGRVTIYDCRLLGAERR